MPSPTIPTKYTEKSLASKDENNDMKGRIEQKGEKDLPLFADVIVSVEIPKDWKKPPRTNKWVQQGCKTQFVFLYASSEYMNAKI